MNVVQIAQARSKVIENNILEGYATKSCDAIRQNKERADIRPEFFHDTDRILHSKSYTRYIDKTQVFYLFDNDDITHRVLHVQFVSKIARVIGRVLSLNEDLIEAIAIGHDLGHPPFGHDGESYLNKLCVSHGIGHFVHSVQSVIFLDNIERRLGNKPLNLSLQVLDGIICHDGERSDICLRPNRNKNWKVHLEERKRKTRDHGYKLIPMTLEGCVVRFADTIAYLGRDIEDARTVEVIKKKEELPCSCTRILGKSNRDIIRVLVNDLIEESRKSIRRNDEICYSKKVYNALVRLKDFNYNHIYLNDKIKRESAKIEVLYNVLYDKYLGDIRGNNGESEIFSQWVNVKDSQYIDKCKPAEIVRDFLASLTDDYFIELFRRNYYPKRFGMHL